MKLPAVTANAEIEEPPSKDIVAMEGGRKLSNDLNFIARPNPGSRRLEVHVSHGSATAPRGRLSFVQRTECNVRTCAGLQPGKESHADDDKIGMARALQVGSMRNAKHQTVLARARVMLVVPNNDRHNLTCRTLLHLYPPED